MVAARELLTPRGRAAAGAFLVEGPQAVGSALAHGSVRTLFATPTAAARQGALVGAAARHGAEVVQVEDDVLGRLADTVHPQGLVAVVDVLDVSLAELKQLLLVAVLVDVADPGNVGTVVRVADAAGCDAVVLAGRTADPYNGKAVRASAGSVFHVPLVLAPDADASLAALQARGLGVVLTDGHAATSVDDPSAAPALRGPAAWVFGNEARGLGADLGGHDTLRLKVPMHGSAESLNVATAAAVCLYAAARQQRAAGGCRAMTVRETSG